MVNAFSALNQDEVVSVEPDTFNNLDVSKTFKVLDLIVAIREYVGADGRDEENLYYSKGLNCEVLKLGTKGWQKGKVRITLEFCPDEPESPLDDLRQQLKQIEHQ
jgi:hypothetical protein